MTYSQTWAQPDVLNYTKDYYITGRANPVFRAVGLR